MNNIFVYIEIEDGAIADVSLELLTKGRELAATLGVKLEAVVLGHNVEGIEKELAAYGADTVWVADDELFAPFRTLPHTSVLCGLIKKTNFSIPKVMRIKPRTVRLFILRT